MSVNKREPTREEVEAAVGSPWLKHISIGIALTDALDAFITDGRMEPQVALKVLATFDRVVAEVLAEKVKARLSFKVCARSYTGIVSADNGQQNGQESNGSIGPPRYLPLLRRSLDFHH